ncbi:hypothetical protein [Amycolatopsis anabasis]|uniref:hypothetical protein n=1 Tax=Amycolatopsis anabasis TaxID=1840409 RepID=UPI001C5527F8|nr:hypothetical protein [Amycolatopsis anabasis]
MSAAVPRGSYAPPTSVEDTEAGLRVEVRGEDGRQRVFRVDLLPLPGWHRPLAAALAERTSPAGGLRTAVSAKAGWASAARFVRFLDTLPRPPAGPAALTCAHVEAFQRFRAATAGERYAGREMREVGKLLKSAALRDLVPDAVLEVADRRVVNTQPTPKPGYSEDEFARLVAAARADVANLRDRIQAGETLVGRYRTAPGTLEPEQREHAAVLARMASTGAVPPLEGLLGVRLARRRELAGELFLTVPDLAPLLVLLVVVTGRNVETIKELPVEHRVLEGRAVELRLVKRRRGQKRWFDTVTWETGRPGRELHTPGGLYLLVHELARRSRRFSRARLLWSVWRNGHRAHRQGPGEHHALFDKTLEEKLYASEWAHARGLTADQPGPESRDDATSNPESSQPLRVDFNRLKTSVDVRRTKHLGGHLPSAARTNSIPVLFRNYLRGDPTVVEWAHDIVGEAVADAEQSALAAHHRALEAAGGRVQVVSGPADAEHLRRAGLDPSTARQAARGPKDTAWSACIDHDHHPATGKPCRESFLDCFHCGNCVITRDHLPRLLGLLDAFAARRDQVSETEWWARYGMAWAAIRHDVLGKFSPAEIEQATTVKTTDALLDLVENPWEHP